MDEFGIGRIKKQKINIERKGEEKLYIFVLAKYGSRSILYDIYFI